jgi:hypothetical protein
LNYFLNFIYNHNKLKEIREFTKFIKDPEFDEEYFKKEELIYDCAESLNYNNTISQKIYGMFSGISSYFIHKEEGKLAHSESESVLAKMENYYKSLLENLKEVKHHMVRKYIYI